MREYYIYTLENEGKIFYIGKTIDPKTRLRKHKSESKLKRTYKEKFINKVLYDGGKIELNILDTVEYDNVDFWEIYWISQFRQWGFNLCNGSDGGEGGNNFKGRKHSDETKAILREHRLKQNEINGIIKFNGESNGRSKLTNEKVLEIRRLRDENNTSYGKLSLQFGVSKPVIIDICKRKKWKHI